MMWVCALAVVMAASSVYDTLTSAPFRWRFDEAQHFTTHLAMSFEDYTEACQYHGRSVVENLLLDALTENAEDCPAAREPAALIQAWRDVLLMHQERRDQPVVAGPFARAASVAARGLALGTCDTCGQLFQPVRTLPGEAPQLSCGFCLMEPLWPDEDFLEDDLSADQQPVPALSLERSSAVSQAVSAVSSVPRAKQVASRPVPVGANGLEHVGAPRGSKRQKAVIDMAADKSASAQAVMEFRDKLYAERTWSSHLSEVRLYVAMCDSNSITAFPISANSIELFAALLDKNGYDGKSIPQYVNAVYRQQILLQMPISQELRDWKRLQCSAAVRDVGESHRMLPIAYKHLSAMRDFVTGPFHVFLHRMAVLTWFFVMRIDESLGSKEHRGLTREAVFLDPVSRSVTVTLGVTKMNQEGAKCRRTLTCLCPADRELSEQQRSLPMCPYCAAVLVCTSNMADHDQPFRPPTGKKRGPKSDHMLEFLRDMLAQLADKFPDWGLDLKTLVGRNLYGTHSLRRGAAQALVEAGHSVDDVKWFGRWLSDAIELYLLQVPIRKFGAHIAASMAGLHQCLTGQDPAGNDKPDVLGPVQSHARSVLSVGDQLQVSLPDFVFDSISADDSIAQGLPAELVGEPSSGRFVGEIVAFLPEVTLALQRRDISFHSSISDSFPHDFSKFQSRSISDKCVLLDFSDGDAAAPLLAVCLSSIHFLIMSSSRP